MVGTSMMPLQWMNYRYLLRRIDGKRFLMLGSLLLSNREFKKKMMKYAMDPVENIVLGW